MTLTDVALDHHLRRLEAGVLDTLALLVPEETPEAALVAIRDAHAGLLEARRAIRAAGTIRAYLDAIREAHDAP